MRPAAICAFWQTDFFVIIAVISFKTFACLSQGFVTFPRNSLSRRRFLGLVLNLAFKVLGERFLPFPHKLATPQLFTLTLLFIMKLHFGKLIRRQVSFA